MMSYLENLNYIDVLNNCETRIYADMKKVNEYINKYKNNYEDIIIKRHQKYIKEYIKSGYDLFTLAKNIKVSSGNLLSIFLRIESQFDLYERYEAKEKLKEKIRIQKNRKNVFKRFNPGLSENKNKEIIDILKKTYNKGYDKILPERINVVLNLLYKGKTMKEIADELNRSYKYLTSTIIGLSNPRNNSEKGVIKLLQENGINI